MTESQHRSRLRRLTKRTALGVAVAFVLAQFIQPKRNLSAAPAGPDDFIVRFKPPADVAQMLRAACYDCHSDSTRYPWYAYVQPAAWWLAEHVEEGKDALNFSWFGAYSAARQSRKLGQIANSVANREMPLPSYTWMHRDARLSDAQADALSGWIDTLSDQLLAED
jgi:hypothetical protein